MSADDTRAARLVIVLSSAAADAATLALRYAATAAAMDATVELHAISGNAVRLFHRGAANAAWLTQVRQATELGAKLYACPLALADAGMQADDLIDEVSGVRGAASLLGAGLASGSRLLNF